MTFWSDAGQSLAGGAVIVCHCRCRRKL